MSNRPTCASCRFARPNRDFEDAHSCQRNPPVHDGNYAYGQWPVVRPWSWCGEWNAIVRLETLKTQDIGKPIAELTWSPIPCDLCQRIAWSLWYAPEGGLLVQCECGHTRLVHVDHSVEAPLPSPQGAK